MTNPFYDPYVLLTKVYSEGAHLKIALAETPIEELNRARTVRTVYGVLENDGYLGLCIAAFAERPPKAAVRTLLKIALYWLIFLKKPRYMVTDTAVDLVKKLGKGGMAGFVNAFLRRFDAEKVQLPAGAAGLAVRSNFPLFAVEELLSRYGERAEDICLARSRGVPVRFERGEEAYLSRPHDKTPFPHLYLFKNFPRDEGFDRGDYTFQSVGSVAVCDAVEPCGEFLDACAAPGGKSVLISKKCARVLSCELHGHRVELIRSYFRRMGVENAEAVQADSSVFDPALFERFDGILCDVPCSGLGTVAENPDLALNKRAEDVAELTKVQLSILTNCARYLRRGGTIYYSTCSVLNAENDGVVGEFLKGNGGFSAEEVSSPLAHERTEYGIQFLPDRAFGAGFYLAKLRRKA